MNSTCLTATPDDELPTSDRLNRWIEIGLLWLALLTVIGLWH